YAFADPIGGPSHPTAPLRIAIAGDFPRGAASQSLHGSGPYVATAAALWELSAVPIQNDSPGSLAAARPPPAATVGVMAAAAAGQPLAAELGEGAPHGAIGGGGDGIDAVDQSRDLDCIERGRFVLQHGEHFDLDLAHFDPPRGSGIDLISTCG